jgi:hypothetical protein
MKTIYFVLSAISNNNLISAQIEAKTASEAEKKFINQYSFPPKEILGPFYKAKQKLTKNVKTIQFTNDKPHKAIYGDWLVNAFFLSEPKGQAYLILIKRIDDKKVPIPKGIITVPSEKLRLL